MLWDENEGEKIQSNTIESTPRSDLSPIEATNDPWCAHNIANGTWRYGVAAQTTHRSMCVTETWRTARGSRLKPVSIRT